MTDAVWTICNACISGDFAQVVNIIEIGGLDSIIKMMDSPDASLKSILLKAVYNIFRHGINENGLNHIADFFESLGGVSKIVKLQHDGNNEVNKLAEIGRAHV